MDSIVVFDGTSYFVEEKDYLLPDDEEVVFRGTFELCCEKCEELNDGV